MSKKRMTLSKVDRMKTRQEEFAKKAKEAELELRKQDRDDLHKKYKILGKLLYEEMETDSVTKNGYTKKLEQNLANNFERSLFGLAPVKKEKSSEEELQEEISSLNSDEGHNGFAPSEFEVVEELETTPTPETEFQEEIDFQTETHVSEEYGNNFSGETSFLETEENEFHKQMINLSENPEDAVRRGRGRPRKIHYED